MHRFGRMILAAALALSAFAPTASAAPVSTAAVWAPPPIRVAVVRSQTTIDWLNARNTPGRYPHSGKEIATLAYLRDKQWNVDEIIGDRDLLDMAKLRQYDVVVLPHVFGMNRQANLNLTRYIAEGGGVVSTLASPRAAPQYAPPAGAKQDQREWWIKIMKYKAWEWGPISEAYQALFIDDNFTPPYDVVPTQHAIVGGVSEILTARGMNGDASGLKISRDPGAGVELVKTLKNNTNAQRVANFGIRDSTVTRRYPGTWPAALASEYRDGRSVYFYFSVTDFLPQYSTALSSRQTATGLSQGAVAGAYLESAIKWAAQNDGVPGIIRRDARTYARVDVWNAAIYVHQYLINSGNVGTTGTLRFKVYDPSGRVVKTWTRYNSGIAPGVTQRWSNSYRPRRSLKPGKYRIVTSYTYGYPATSISYAEHAYVRKAQGRNIKTSLAGPAIPKVTYAVVSTPEISPYGGGFPAFARVGYNLDRWALVDVKVYNAAGTRVATLLLNGYRAPGYTQSVTWNGKTSAGTPVPPGVYSCVIKVRNAKGSSSWSGPITVR